METNSLSPRFHKPISNEATREWKTTYDDDDFLKNYSNSSTMAPDLGHRIISGDSMTVSTSHSRDNFINGTETPRFNINIQNYDFNKSNSTSSANISDEDL